MPGPHFFVYGEGASLRCPIPRVPIGGAIPPGPCLPESMVRLSSRRRIGADHLQRLEEAAKGTIEHWASNWTFSAFVRKDRLRLPPPKELGVNWRISGAESINWGLPEIGRRSSSVRSFGGSRAITTITENMYFTEIDGSKYAIKPMNCPGSLLVYRRKMHSYRDLPLRYAELGLVHRHELSGVLHGLMRVRNFTQDDAHIFMTPAHIEEEILGVMDLVDYVYKDVFGFNYHVELSTRPENSMGSDELWERATAALEGALKRKGLSYGLKGMGPSTVRRSISISKIASAAPGNVEPSADLMPGALIHYIGKTGRSTGR